MYQEQPERSAATQSAAGDGANDQFSAGSHGNAQHGDHLPPSYGTTESKIDNVGTTEHHEAASPKKGIIQTLKEKLTGHKHHNDPVVAHHEDDVAMADPDDHANVGCMDKLKGVVSKQKPSHEIPPNATEARDGDSPRVDRDGGMADKETAADEEAKNGDSPRVDRDGGMADKGTAADEHGGAAANALHSKPKVQFQEDEHGDGGNHPQTHGDGGIQPQTEAGYNSFQESTDDSSGGLMHPKGHHNHGHSLHHHHDDPEMIKPNIHGIKSSDPGNVFVSRDDHHAPGDSPPDPSLHHDLSEKAAPPMATAADSFPEDQTSPHDPPMAPAADSLPEDQTSPADFLPEDQTSPHDPPMAPAADSLPEDQTSPHNPPMAPAADSLPQDQASPHDPPMVPAADSLPQDQASPHDPPMAPAADSFPQDQTSPHDKFLNDLTPQALAPQSHRPHQHERRDNWPDREEQIETSGNYSQQGNPLAQNQLNSSRADPNTKDYTQQHTSMNPELDQQNQQSPVQNQQNPMQNQRNPVSNQRSFTDFQENPHDQQIPSNYAHQQHSSMNALDDHSHQQNLPYSAEDSADSLGNREQYPSTDPLEQPPQLNSSHEDAPVSIHGEHQDPDTPQLEHQPNQVYPSHTAPAHQNPSKQPLDREENQLNPSQYAAPISNNDHQQPSNYDHKPNNSNPSQYSAPNIEDNINQQHPSMHNSQNHQRDQVNPSSNYSQHPSMNPDDNQPNQLNDPSNASQGTDFHPQHQHHHNPPPNSAFTAPDTASQGINVESNKSDNSNKVGQASDFDGWPRPVHPSQIRSGSTDEKGNVMGGKPKKEGFVSKLKDKFNLGSSTPNA